MGIKNNLMMNVMPVRDPVAPEIPDEIIQKMTDRYVMAYEKLTGNTL